MEARQLLGNTNESGPQTSLERWWDGQSMCLADVLISYLRWEVQRYREEVRRSRGLESRLPPEEGGFSEPMFNWNASLGWELGRKDTRREPPRAYLLGPSTIESSAWLPSRYKTHILRKRTWMCDNICYQGPSQPRLTWRHITIPAPWSSPWGFPQPWVPQLHTDTDFPFFWYPEHLLSLL